MGGKSLARRKQEMLTHSVRSDVCSEVTGM